MNRLIGGGLADFQLHKLEVIFLHLGWPLEEASQMFHYRVYHFQLRYGRN
jgi:hypothetical protein